MICYADKTWCTFLDCTDKKCNRRFDHKEMKKAKKWWGNDVPPVCTFYDKPDCYNTEQEDAQNKSQFNRHS